MKPLHWMVYVGIATCGTMGISLLVASAFKQEPTHGHFGLLLALVASVASCGVICDRFARRLCDAVQGVVETGTAERRGVSPTRSAAQC